MEWLFDHLSLDGFIRWGAARTAHRLMTVEFWVDLGTERHWSILETVVERDPAFLMISDALLPGYELDRGFAVCIPEKNTLIQQRLSREVVASDWYTAGSRFECGDWKGVLQWQEKSQAGDYPGCSCDGRSD